MEANLNEFPNANTTTGATTNATTATNENQAPIVSQAQQQSQSSSEMLYETETTPTRAGSATASYRPFESTIEAIEDTHVHAFPAVGADT